MPISTLGVPNPPDSLIIFNRFEVDLSLPKNFVQKSLDTINIRDTFISVGSFSVENGSIPRPPWYKRLFYRKEKITPPVKIKQIFEQILLNPEELKIFEDRENKVLELRGRAVLAGQTSLVDSIDEESEVRKFENTLFALGMKKYISEKQLLQFTAVADRALCLDWIKNFVRPIPNEAVEAKVKCDELKLFDNYVVLHYDPENRGTLKKDREALKDPILFGVVRGSRKLYFVGDWKDELCDLTFQQIIDKMGSNLEIV
ncbi:MAG: hypothetical protein UY48_C0009G0019 [Candidatus Gottesmanbacteria bacterium GW2011_GWB1_49_7]|uniref:Uncharacterized protein n=1 Tax=Candidatus Gottesmanbacteria bacterium GW2011_GWB1_49_7 TaxID=1618448 RepID=A0A0G1W215_9BACT|nr:MAG: hypothetical protein UY48_C0009G0019 [Candidatus Gottesmanbacteria bacterium GW2011_GWB1_49_7]